MAKERFVIRVQPASDLKQLVRRVLYNRPSLVEPTLRLLCYIRECGGCVEDDLVKIAHAVYARLEDVEYIVRRLTGVGMLSHERGRICLSDKFVQILQGFINIWRSFLTGR